MLTLTIHEKQISCAKHQKIYELVEEDEKDIVYGAIFNGKMHDLNYEIKEDGELEFIYDTSETGKLIYERSLSFLFIAAVKSLYEHTRVRIEFSFANGLYCEIDGPHESYDSDAIEKKMWDIVQRRESIHRRVVSKEQAIVFFESIKMQDKADLLRYRKSNVCSVYRLCHFDDYFYGIMLPNTSYLTHFSIQTYHQGFWLSSQENFIDQPNFFKTFQYFKNYWRTHGLASVSQVNKKIMDGNINQIVQESEGLIRTEYQKLMQNMHKDVRLILIAGPSSAGKTTFSRRLAKELGTIGIQTIAISMDDYYLNREDTPKLHDGSYDFENIECVDLKLFNEHMKALTNHEEVRLPKYNFKTGKREWRDETVRLGSQQVFIVEGIHGLNPRTSSAIPDAQKFKIYINDLNTLNYDHHNRIPTSDYRLLRRIVRDHQFRGYSAKDTIATWSRVRLGEIRYIYPYQEDADFIFNTSMIYELSILKKIAMPELEKIQRGTPEFQEANRLIKLLDYIVEGDESYIPNDSILREFIGHSSFFE